MPERPEDHHSVFLRKVGYMIGFAGETGVLIGLGIWFGARLDERWDTSPGMLLAGLALALTAAGWRLADLLRRMLRLTQKPPEGRT